LLSKPVLLVLLREQRKVRSPMAGLSCILPHHLRSGSGVRFRPEADVTGTPASAEFRCSASDLHLRLGPEEADCQVSLTSPYVEAVARLSRAAICSSRMLSTLHLDVRTVRPVSRQDSRCWPGPFCRRLPVGALASNVSTDPRASSQVIDTATRYQAEAATKGLNLGPDTGKSSCREPGTNGIIWCQGGK
jgi:hypothetical protein